MAKAFSGVFDDRVWKLTEKWTRLRLIGSMTSVYEFWIPIVGRNDRRMKICKLCLCWDPVKEVRGGTCPYCKAGLPGERVHYTNAIIRKLQGATAAHGGPPIQASPVRVVRLTPRLHSRLDSLVMVNKRQTKSGEWKQYDLAHPKLGCDIRIRVEHNNGYIHHGVQPREQKRLTADELAHRLVPLDITLETPEQAKAEWRKLKRYYTGA